MGLHLFICKNSFLSETKTNDFNHELVSFTIAGITVLILILSRTVVKVLL